MGTLCIYLNFKINWPNSAKHLGGGRVVYGAYPRGDMGGGASDFLFHVCKFAWWSNVLG